MKYRVVGWTGYDDPDVEVAGCSEAALQAILCDIRENGYRFTGWDHQELSNCAPVLNDGCKRLFTQRGFGSVMAQAYGDYSRMGYTQYAFQSFFGYTPSHLPPYERAYDPSSFSPETDLCEEFFYEVDRETFDAAVNREVIRLPNDPALLMIDGGDTLTLICGEERVSLTVAHAERCPDLTPAEERAIYAAALSYDTAEIEAANERYDTAPRVLRLSFLWDEDDDDTDDMDGTDDTDDTDGTDDTDDTDNE